MGHRRGVRRRGAAGVVPIVVLGAAISLGVVAVTASRFGRRRTKSNEGTDQPVTDAPETTGTDREPVRDAQNAQETPVRSSGRFKHAPSHDPHAPRWDTPPPALTAAERDPPESAQPKPRDPP